MAIADTFALLHTLALREMFPGRDQLAWRRGRNGQDSHRRRALARGQPASDFAAARTARFLTSGRGRHTAARTCSTRLPSWHRTKARTQHSHSAQSGQAGAQADRPSTTPHTRGGPRERWFLRVHVGGQAFSTAAGALSGPDAASSCSNAKCTQRLVDECRGTSSTRGGGTHCPVFWSTRWTAGRWKYFDTDTSFWALYCGIQQTAGPSSTKPRSRPTSAECRLIIGGARNRRAGVVAARWWRQGCAACNLDRPG